MAKYKITIAGQIKRYRENNNLTQNDFAKLFGVSSQAVYKWEHDLCYPDITLLPIIAEVLDCPTDNFFEALLMD